MKRSIFLLLCGLLLLCGCANVQATAPSEPAAAAVQTHPTQAEPLQETQPSTEPEIPQHNATLWLAPYVTDTGKIEFHCLVRNETSQNLIIDALQTTCFKGEEILQTNTYSRSELTGLLWRPFNSLELTPMESTLLLLPYDPTVIDFHTLVVTVTGHTPDEDVTLTYHFTADPMQATPWENPQGNSPSYIHTMGWNWVHNMTNNTQERLTLEVVHRTEYLSGVCVATETKPVSQMNQYIQTVADLAPGEFGSYTTGITEQMRNFDLRETIFVYRGESGKQYSYTFYFPYSEAMTLAEYENTPKGVSVLLADDGINALGGLKLTEEQIRTMVAENWNLDQAAEAITTVGDALKFMGIRGFTYSLTPMQRLYYQNQSWNILDSAQVIYQKNMGACGCGSTILNYLLQEDYDCQGYVMEVNSCDRHIYNWILQDGIYYFVDWTWQTLDQNYSSNDYQIWSAEDPQAFSDYFIPKSRSDPNIYDIYLQYIYPQDGPVIPIGIHRTTPPYTRILPTEYESKIQLLYQDTSMCNLTYKEGPPQSMWNP